MNKTRLNSKEACKAFLNDQSPQAIAKQLRQDKAACQKSMLPSLLALYMPSMKTSLANDVALELFPETARYPTAIRMSQYSGLIMIIKSTLQNMQVESRYDALPGGIDRPVTKAPSLEDVTTALGVLDFWLKVPSSDITLQTPLQDVIHNMKEQLRADSFPDVEQKESIPAKLSIRNSLHKKCYICQYVLLTPHPQYSSLCKACGDYNLASSELSLPSKLNLQGRTALVTGGRINLGYHTALRLLRCGAYVIVSTRYPQDAGARYLAEPDASIWSHRLRIIGADFRSAKDVFHLVNMVKQCLSTRSSGQTPKLDMLINNAAQTLTDSVEKEGRALRKEKILRVKCPESGKLLLGDYSPRIRGGARTTNYLAFEQPLTISHPSSNIEINEDGTMSSSDCSHEVAELPASPPASSWLQSLQQIPYEDVISAHSVNTFVPLILIREFLPIMRSIKDTTKTENTLSRASSYIINVSSREGIFESTSKSASKHGKHVHTNLTKAALNMLTETEAGPAWKHGKVAINTVDPGFMSAAPEVQKRWEEKEGDDWTCPISWEDGAGRVLWPIAFSESGSNPIWGRFLKHFGAVEIDVSVGR